MRLPYKSDPDMTLSLLCVHTKESMESEIYVKMQGSSDWITGLCVSIINCQSFHLKDRIESFSNFVFNNVTLYYKKLNQGEIWLARMHI